MITNSLLWLTRLNDTRENHRSIFIKSPFAVLLKVLFVQWMIIKWCIACWRFDCSLYIEVLSTCFSTDMAHVTRCHILISLSCMVVSVLYSLLSIMMIHVCMDSFELFDVNNNVPALSCRYKAVVFLRDWHSIWCITFIHYQKLPSLKEKSMIFVNIVFLRGWISNL